MPKFESRRLRDAVATLSLSSLCFISAWQVLLNPGHYSYYYWKNYPGFTEIIALILDILLLAVLFSVGITVTRRLGRGALAKGARVLFVLLLVIPLNSLRVGSTSLNDLNLFGFVGRTLVVSGCLLLGAILLVLWRWSSGITRTVASILMILSPFSLIALSQGIWLAQRHRSDNLMRWIRECCSMPGPMVSNFQRSTAFEARRSIRTAPIRRREKHSYPCRR